MTRSWWWSRQGLDGSLRGATPAAVLERSGWARSVGGVSPYLTFFSRAGLSRGDVDAAVGAFDIHELPAARGCTYIVPEQDYALALRAARDFGDAELKAAQKLGVTQDELDRLCDAVKGALLKLPKDPDDLRAEVGPAARSLGEAGKKKGLSTTLPLALGRLQLQGEVRRIPPNGRIDQQRYRYGLWRPNPLAFVKLTDEEAFAELTRRYLRWIGPATLEELCWFAAMGKRAAQAALGQLGAVPLAAADSRWIFEDDREALLSHAVPKKRKGARSRTCRTTPSSTAAGWWACGSSTPLSRSSCTRCS
jgi:hypothetical protein